MSTLDSVILTIGGSAVALILGYVLNGWRERNFERRKTNYHSKLAAFKEINEAVWGLENAYVYLRMILDSAKLPLEDESVGEKVMLSALAHDLESPLGTKTSDDLMKGWDSIVARTQSGESVEVGPWIAGADMSLTVLYMRVLNHHFGKLTRASLDAKLVAETTLVDGAIKNLGSYLNKKLSEFPPAHTVEEKGPITGDLFDLNRIQEELDPLLEALQSAMHHELSKTM